jgi:hypothetical protein
MDAVSAANPSAVAASTQATATTGSSTSASKTDGKSFATLFAEAKTGLEKGETLTTVDGHEFARIKGGTRDKMCVNLSGNGRSGQAFDLIWRDGRQFHVYGGQGAGHKVVEVGHKAAATTTAATTGGTAAADTSTGSTTATTTGSSSAGSGA